MLTGETRRASSGVVSNRVDRENSEAKHRFSVLVTKPRRQEWSDNIGVGRYNT